MDKDGKTLDIKLWFDGLLSKRDLLKNLTNIVLRRGGLFFFVLKIIDDIRREGEGKLKRRRRRRIKKNKE